MAWTNAWDETRPADSDLANTLGVQLRAEKVDIRERLNFQHVWGVNTTDDGNHRNIVIPSAYMAANQEVLKAVDYVLTASDDIVVFTAGNHNATLMTAIGRTKLVYIKNRGSGTITVLTTGGQTIDGVSSQTLLPGDALTFNSDGSNWSIV